MPNPDPTLTPEFVANIGRGDDSGQPIAKTPIATKYGEDVDAVLRRLDDRSSYIRAAVRAAMVGDGLI